MILSYDDTFMNTVTWTNRTRYLCIGDGKNEYSDRLVLPPAGQVVKNDHTTPSRPEPPRIVRPKAAPQPSDNTWNF